MENAYALVFGVSSYVHVETLPSTVQRGAEEVAAILADPHLGGYPPEQVRVLVDGEVTREVVLEELRTLAGRTCDEPDAIVFLYFAGHGGRPDGDGVYLLTADADPADFAASAVSGAELSAAIAALPARRVLVVFDCCHAGGLGDTGLPTPLASGLPESYCQDLAAGRGRVVLASARADERSWLGADEEPSVFTRHLLAALRGAAGEDGRIRAWDLFEYVQPRVTAERGDQHPVFKAELEENFPVALHLGGQGKIRSGAEDGFPYHAYVSYADVEPDATWVWETLVPRLEEAGLAVAVSGDVEAPGVFRVVGAERGITRARRTVVVLSEAYLEDEMTGFIDALAQTLGLEEGCARLLPVGFGDVPADRLPARLRMLVRLDLGDPARGRRNMNRLVKALHASPPKTR